MLRQRMCRWITRRLRAYVHATVFAALPVLLVLPVANVLAANTSITWGFSPTPTAVSVAVGDTVTWNGNLVFHPLIVTDAAFTTIGATVSSGGASYVRSFTAPGTYYFMCGAHGSSMPTTVTVTCSLPPGTLAAFDIDGNGQVDAATDGLLVLRYLLGMRGAALVTGALGPCASRDATAIEAYLAMRVMP